MDGEFLLLLQNMQADLANVSVISGLALLQSARYVGCKYCTLDGRLVHYVAVL